MFKQHPWYKMIYYRLRNFYNRIRYPENVWYGGGLKRETALDCVGKGWDSIINNLYDAKPKSVKVQQVKEKFGTLRFYVSYGPDWYSDLISYYECLSGTVCEQCGKPGKLRNDGWMVTLCDDCYNNGKKL